MIIKEKNEEILVLEKDRKDLRKLRWYLLISLFGWPLYSYCQTASLESSRMALLLSPLRILSFAGIILSLLFFWILLNDSRGNPNQKCVFDKKNGKITLYQQVIWRLWIEQEIEYDLQDIRFLEIIQVDSRFTVDLVLKGEVSVKLASQNGEGELENTVKETALFLDVPLQNKVNS